jgi:thiol-disulfide isomerase/thioredoxin
MELTTPQLLDPAYLQDKHAAGLSYGDYLATGTAKQQADWTATYDAAELTPEQHRLVASFQRQLNVLCLSGIWCGDCVQQVPLIQRIAEANPDRIDVRYLDRDEHADLQAQVTINAGNRVPVLVFCAEDHELVSWYGDRTLSRYRALAAKQLGAACPLPGAPVAQGELDATLADWLGEFERVHLLLRLSTRMRRKYGD